MAGSFDIFRKYQRGMLAAVAILAMLAFFVLPPFLDMAPDVGASDPLAATWRGGGIREGDLQRELAMRAVLNQFLRDAIAASGRDPGDVQVLGEDEADVVRTLLLAREAEANGIVIGNGAVNQFLAQWTNNMVRPEQFEALLRGRRMGPVAVSPADVFAALRNVLAADRMRQLSFAGFAGDPPGARWDIFRRLDQGAAVEVVPVVVEAFAADVPAPAEPALRAFFDRHKESLPIDRSPEPGFREPHRISYDWLVAKSEELEAAAAKDVTDEQIQKFYDENKVRLYRVKAAAEPAAKEPAAQAPPAQEPAADEPASGEDKAAPDEAAKPAGTEDGAARGTRGLIVPARFRQAKEQEAGPAAGTEGDTAAADQPVAGPAAGETKPADAAPGAADGPAAQPADPAAEGVEPLEKVRDDVRTRLAADAVSRRIDGLFRAVTADVVGFSRDLSRWKSASGAADARPVPPNADAIAAKQGLGAGHAEKRTAGEAAREGGVGATFQLSLDPRSPMGFRQARWTDLFFAPDRQPWRPVETRDVAGDRYLTWKTEDVPSFVPEFDAVRADVERAWRIVEARPQARRVAEEIVAGATDGRTLADAVSGRPGPKLEAATVGPFTWLAPGSGSPGMPVSVAQPAGLEMPGEDFMRAVFALEPGGTAVAFNEPQTVCYAIRLVSYTPSEEDLRKKFIDSSVDQRRLGAVAEREQARAFESWLRDVERRAGLEWKRPPQGR